MKLKLDEMLDAESLLIGRVEADGLPSRPRQRPTALPERRDDKTMLRLVGSQVFETGVAVSTYQLAPGD